MLPIDSLADEKIDSIKMSWQSAVLDPPMYHIVPQLSQLIDSVVLFRVARVRAGRTTTSRNEMLCAARHPPPCDDTARAVKLTARFTTALPTVNNIMDATSVVLLLHHVTAVRYCYRLTRA